MALEQKLSLKLSQRLVMTPSLQQAIKLLQMTRLELESDRRAGARDQSGSRGGREEATEEEERVAVERAARSGARGASDAGADCRAPAARAGGVREPISTTRRESDGGSYGESENREAPPLENTLTREPDLYDHLLWQIHMSDFPPHEREIAELDRRQPEPGRLPRRVGRGDPSTGSRATAREQPLAMERGHTPFSSASGDSILRASPARPAGEPAAAARAARGARGLARRGESSRTIGIAFLRRQYAAIARASWAFRSPSSSRSIEDIRRCRPGRDGSSPTTARTTSSPTSTSIKVGDEYVIQLNDDGLPRLRISRSYRQHAARACVRRAGRTRRSSSSPRRCARRSG